MKMPLEQAIREVQAWNPDMLGFSAHACQTIRDMLHWAIAFKERTGLPAIVGGYEAKAYPEEILGHGCFDFLCTGEAHTWFPAFLRAFEQGHGYEKIPDLFWMEGGRPRHTPPGPKQKFCEYPTPDRSIFPNHLYYSHVSQRRSFTIGMSEIGCPFPCTFCCMRLSGYDPRTAMQVVDEMEECRALGIREVDWFDPLMLRDRQRALDISREVKRRKLDVIWSCRSRVDSLSFGKSTSKPDTELIEALAEGGCRRIYFGLEAGDDDVLKQMMKGQVATGGYLRRTLGEVADAGIMSLGFFILGAPGDTPQTVKRTIDFSQTLPLAYAQFQIAIIKPHTELERRHIVEETNLDYWREYVKGTVDEMLLPTPWTEMQRPELEKLAREAYFRFYGRPRYAMGMLSRIESFEEFARYARVGGQLLLRPLRPRSVASRGRRAARAGLTLAEALLTLGNPGARHPVFKEGGGVRAAVKLAREEYRHVEHPPVLTPEVAAKLKAERGIASPVIKTDRYVPFHDLKDKDKVVKGAAK